MDEMSKHGRVGLAAMRSGMHRNTATRYVKADSLPSELKSPRTWRTREDPFAEDWPEIAARLEEALPERCHPLGGATPRSASRLAAVARGRSPDGGRKECEEIDPPRVARGRDAQPLPQAFP
jgi:hypothetical protein